MENQPRAKLEIEGDLLRCRDEKGGKVWETPISQIVLIAEYTTNEGPFVDDYFLNFWTCEEGLRRLSVTFYADGCDEAIKLLSERLGAELQLDLFSSAEWKSRVVWPRVLAGHPYFTFREVEPESRFQRVKRFCFGPDQQYFYADEVRAFLACCKPDVQTS